MSIMQGYKDQVALLLSVLPFIQEESCFALKGGTAINLFYCDMPRLSVDIDLTYLPIEPRTIFLENVSLALHRLANKLEKSGFYVTLKQIQGYPEKLQIENEKALVKVEVNLVLRGSVYPAETIELTQRGQDLFLQTQKVKSMSKAEVYAGKICAALDRQHPRDLFDIKLLFENEGVTNEIRQAFVVYLASSSRPMHELLFPNELDMEAIYHKEFIGMTDVNIPYEELCQTRILLVKTVQSRLTSNERLFLLSIKKGEPDYSLMPFENLHQLPALQWKIMNIKKMDKQKHKVMLDKLAAALEI